MKKAPGDIILHICTKNYNQMMCSSLDMVHSRLMDRRTDKKSDIHWWVPHLKVHTYADSSPRKVGIILDLEHFVSFVELGILCFALIPMALQLMPWKKL